MFPKGLVIGTVETVEEEIISISNYAVIKPGIDVNNISNCLVLINGSENE